MAEATWKDINGKTINFKLDSGEIIEALVIANPDVGISIKPMDPADVPPHLPWKIPPSDPNFFFVCMDNPKERQGIFNHWIQILSEKREFFKAQDVVLGFAATGTCPFAS